MAEQIAENIVHWLQNVAINVQIDSQNEPTLEKKSVAKWPK